MRVIDTASPECAWPPFMAWIEACGLDPNNVATVTIYEPGDTTPGPTTPADASRFGRVVAGFQLFARDPNGDKVVDDLLEEVCTFRRHGVVVAAPRPRPLRP